MNELIFRKWLANNGYNNKVVSDTVSRLKKLEHSVNNCDIDSEFKKDNCAYYNSLSVGLNRDNFLFILHFSGRVMPSPPTNFPLMMLLPASIRNPSARSYFR
jgi:hypothetical protein